MLRCRWFEPSVPEVRPSPQTLVRGSGGSGGGSFWIEARPLCSFRQAVVMFSTLSGVTMLHPRCSADLQYDDVQHLCEEVERWLWVTPCDPTLALELSCVPTPNRIKLLAPITVTSEEKKFSDWRTSLFSRGIELQSGRLFITLVPSSLSCLVPMFPSST